MKNEMRYKQGDILLSVICERKVLGVCGEVYLVSCGDKFDEYEGSYTQKELDELGFALKTEPEIKELTLEYVAKLAGTDVKNIKIVEG